MKHAAKVLLLAALTVALAAPALADIDMVLTTGAVNLREGPGVEYAIVGGSLADMPLGYVNLERDVQADSSGTDWYRVDRKYWVSSKYVTVLDFKLRSDIIEPYADLSFDPDKLQDYAEIRSWLGRSLHDAAAALGLEGRVSTLPDWLACYHEGAVIAGLDWVCSVDLMGQGYTMYGVCPGMDAATACAILDSDPSMVFGGRSQSNVLRYDHLKEGHTRLTVTSGGMDSAMRLSLNEDDIVTAISVSTYGN